MENKPIRSKDRFLVFGAPDIQEAEIEEVVASMKSGWLGTGPKVLRFEKEFAKYKSSEYCAAVNSCTAALHLSMLAAELKPGDEVITTAMTFCATVNAIIHAGAKPVLADVDIRTMNIDPIDIKRRINARTRAIIPVHFAGRPCEMEEIMDLANKHGLIVIEDCAHAIEAEYRGQKTGTFGTWGCFSFYVTKNMTTGEGGIVIAKRDEDIASIKIMALHGMSKDAWNRYSDEGFKHYRVVRAGYKYNMMDIQAAIGIHQLTRLETAWEKRKYIWSRYNHALRDLPICLPAEPDANTRHSYHLYTIMVSASACSITRDDFLNAMTENNIGVGVHYLSIPEHDYYRETFGWKPEDYPNAMRIGRQTVSLPLSAKMSEEDMVDVIAAVRKLVRK